MPARKAETALSRLKQEIDVNINLTQLRDLYSIFTFALSREPNHGCIPLIRAQWTILGYTLKEAPIPCDLGSTSDEDITQVSIYMHFILQFLDDLLSDDILEHGSRLFIFLRGEDAQPSDKPNAVQREYAKLATLTDLIYWRYKLAANESDESTVGILYELSDEVLSNFISLNLDFVRGRRLLEGISQLDWCAGRTFSQESSYQDEAPLNNSFQYEHLVDAQRAKEFSVHSTQLFHLLSQNIGLCGMEHIANLHLSGFGGRDPEFEMLLSLCAKQSPGADWYPVKCKKQSLSNDQNPSLTNMCEYLQESRKRRRRIHLEYDGQKIWQGRIFSTMLRTKPNLALSYKTLPDCIQQSSKIQDNLRDRSRFPEKDRRKLQCLLAQSLLYLFHSPWLPEAWELGGIKFTQDESSYNTGEPYASSTLSQASFLQRGVDYDLDGGRLFMAKFGFLLLQIELGEELELTEDEKDNEEGVETALDRHMFSRSDDLKDRVQQALYACLDFCNLVEQIDSAIVDNDLKPRLVILNHILIPLKEVLEMNYSTVARDFPDLMYSASSEQDRGHQDAIRTQSRSGVFGRSGSPPVASSSLNNPSYERFIYRTTPPQLLGVAMAQSTRVMMSENSFEEKSTTFVSVHQHTPISFPTSPNRLVLFDEDDHTLGSSDSKFNHALDFFQLYDKFHTRYMMPQRIRTRIKIAVLDTGIDISQPSISGHLDVIKMERRKLNPGKMDNPIKANQSFIGGLPTDQCGHGTRVAELLLKVAPYADLYLAKISNGMRDVDADAAGSSNHVAEAIRWAVKHEVDIITMSFGLSGWDSAVNDAIQEATKTSILVAAASNGGGNSGRTFPATHSGVFCIHASDGKGNDSGGMNPSTERFSDSWTTLGVTIPFDDQSVCKSGTSYATPIAAGTIANVFDHLDHWRDQDKLPDQQYRHLRSSDGVSRILWHMSKERNGFRYVAPWNLWDCLCDDSEENIGQSQELVRLKLLKETA